MESKDPKRVAAGRRSKRKGASNERDLAKKFEKWWGTEDKFARTPSSGGWGQKVNREAFKAYGDVTTTATDFPFCLEFKKDESFDLSQLLTGAKSPIYRWWKQTIEETPTGLVPFLVIGKNHYPHIAVFQVKYMIKANLAFWEEEHETPDDIWSPWDKLPHFNLMTPEHSTFTVMALSDFFTIKSELFKKVDSNVEEAQEL